MKGKSNGKGKEITLLALGAALGAAVYLNWSFSQGMPQAVSTSGDTTGQVSLQNTASSADSLSDADSASGSAAAKTEASAAGEAADTMVVFDPLHEEVAETAASTETIETEEANKNYGEAQLVSVSKDSGNEFFESARLARSKTRDEALDTIKKTLKNTALTDDEKTKLTEELNAKVSSVTTESDLETLIKAKGFADCVVMLDGDKADVTVMTENDALTSEEVTRIRDVILGKCRGMAAQNITVVEVK